MRRYFARFSDLSIDDDPRVAMAGRDDVGEQTVALLDRADRAEPNVVEPSFCKATVKPAIVD